MIRLVKTITVVLATFWALRRFGNSAVLWWYCWFRLSLRRRPESHRVPCRSRTAEVCRRGQGFIS